jgi:uncharacterized protein YecT (DUF1311 family)
MEPEPAYTPERSRAPEATRCARPVGRRACAAFRNRWCTFLTHRSEGGSIHAFVLGSCLFDATRDRLKQLHETAPCVEGDLTWPAWAAGR